MLKFLRFKQGEFMLEIVGLTKRYKNSNFYSVKNLNLTLEEGEIFGFLGKNGAGKSTTIKCLTGILPFDEGSIKVCGYDIQKNPIEAKLNIGYVPDNHAVYENLTGREYVNYMGNIYKVPKDIIEERIEKFANLFSMSHAIDNQIRSYSHGMKQKICIIAALIHNPKFWVLDEPLMGLDPQSTFEIREYMKEHKKQGNCVFFSSHNIDMVEKLCDRVAIMNRGQLMEIIDVKKFMAESSVPLETYFLNMTKDSKAQVIKFEDKKETKKKIKAEKEKKRQEIQALHKQNREQNALQIKAIKEKERQAKKERQQLQKQLKEKQALQLQAIKKEKRQAKEEIQSIKTKEKDFKKQLDENYKKNIQSWIKTLNKKLSAVEQETEKSEEKKNKND